MTAYVFKRVKDYYKYEYQDWTQPILTANGNMGGDSFAASQVGFADEGDLKAFRAFDNNTSTNCYFAKSTGYFQWYNPNPLKITNLKLTNFVGDSWGTRALTSGSIQVSNNGSDFVELKTFTNSATGGGASWNIDLSANTGYYKYYRIVCTGTSYAVSNAANQCHIAELKITATEQITVKGSAADYDFRTSKAYVLKRKRPTEYRKKVIDTATAGTYTFDVAKDTTARIILVGGGGGGGNVWVNVSEGGGGGSGACVYCHAKLKAGTYTIANGKGGGENGDGGNSTLSLNGTTLITAGGGSHGLGGNYNGGYGGDGGTYSIADNVEIVKTVFASNGNTGNTGYNMVGASGGASVYSGYGTGGGSNASGSSGYIFVELTTDETDYDYKIDNDPCYVLKRKQYWKYGEAQDWTQPVLTSDNSTPDFVVSGTTSTSITPAYHLFDNNTSTGYGWTSGTSGSFSGKSYYIEMKFSNKVNISNIAVTNRSVSDGSTQTITSGSVQVSDDGVTWNKVTDWTNSNASKGATWNIPVSYSGYYKYVRFYVNSGTTSNSGNNINTIELKLTAQEIPIIKATKDDYDFTTD